MSETREIRGEGWVLYSSILMAIVGALLVVQGLLLIAEDQIYVTGPDEEIVAIANVTTWGLVVLTVGLVSIAGAWGVYRGKQWARFFGITAASLTVLSQVAMIFGPHPLFSLGVMALSVLAIYGLAVYGGQDLSTAP